MSDRTVVYRLRAELTQFRAQIRQGSLSVRQLADDLTGAGRESDTMRRGLETVGDAAGKVGLAAAAGLGAAVFAAANFDQAMSDVQAATHESTQNMEALRAAAIKAGADTAFSATEAAAGIENLAKAGVSTADILDGGLSGALDLAAAGSIDVGTAAEQAATAMNQFKLKGEDVPHIADLLAAAAGKAQGEVTDFGMALNQSGLVAAQMGLSIEETTGTLAAFASAGLEGSDAGTSLKTMLLRLANPSQKASETMEELGIHAYDAQGNFVGLESLSGQLQGAFKGQTQAQRDAALATIFGSDAIRAANVLYSEGSDGIAEWTANVDDSGYAADTAATKLDNLAGDLEAFKGSLETALIGSGEDAQGPLRSLVQGATDVVNAFNEAPDSVQSLTAKLLGITALAGGSLWFATRVVSGVAEARSALSDLGISAGQARGALANIGRGAAGLAAIEATAIALKEVTDQLKTPLQTSSLSRDLEALADGRVTDNFEDLSIWLDDIQDKWERDWNPVSRLTPFDPSGFEDAEAGLAAIDEQLAQLVEGGQADHAAEIFDALADKAAEQGMSVDDLNGVLSEYQTALANTAPPIHSWIDSVSEGILVVSGLKEGENDLASATRKSNQMTEKQKEALKNAQDQARESAEEFYGLGESLDDSKVSLNQWIRQLAKQADALANFRQNAKDAAKKGLDEGLIQSLQNAGEAGALRMKQLANATDEQIERANRAWRRGQKQVDGYVKDVTKYLEKVNDVKLHDKHFKIAVHTVITGGGEGGADFISGGQRRAEGGPIYGPGTPTSDSVPIWASTGEYVVKAAAVDKYGTAFFDSVNAMRFATGGQVGGSPATGGGSIDYDRLARSVGAMQPQRQLYGDVYVSDGYGGFKDQMMRDQQQAAMGGF